MTKKVGIFTTNSVAKIHPRIEMQVRILESEGYEVEVVKTTTRRDNFFFELVNLLSLKYFKWGAILNFKKRIVEFDIVQIYDLQLLPLAKKAKRLKKKVIYETLDDNVHLNFFAVAKKIPFISVFKKIVIRKISKYERNFSNRYCDAVIVNSPNLLANFNQAELIYYASSLEDLSIGTYDSTKETCFVYLGKLTVGKGTLIYKELIRQFDTQLIVLGKAYDEQSKELLNDERVNYLGNFNSMELKKELEKLLKQFNLIGLSIIIPENKSYELQEANKDIDYMSMGVPFIGNERKPTYDKIKYGVGVLYTDNDAIDKLKYNKEESYNLKSQKAKTLYQEYNQKGFKDKYLGLIQNL